MAIDAAPGRGTRITLRIPLPEPSMPLSVPAAPQNVKA
jgi:hypothetical protein